MKVCCLVREIAPAKRAVSSLRKQDGRNAAAVFGTIGALLLPKCPLCLAAWAGALGLGAAPRRLLVHWWSMPALLALWFLPALALAIRKRPFDAAGLWRTAGAAVLVAALSLSRL
jgi:hypothetical protein